VPFTNYCGGGWSDGKYQESVDGKLPPTGLFDATCKKHDAAYYYAKDAYERSDADLAFLKENISLNPIRLIGGLGVYAFNHLSGGSKNRSMSLRGSRDIPTALPDEAWAESYQDRQDYYKNKPGKAIEVTSDGAGNIYNPYKPALPKIDERGPSYDRVSNLINNNTNQYHVRYNPYDFVQPDRLRKKLNNYKASKYWL